MSKVIEIKKCGDCPYKSDMSTICLHQKAVAFVKNTQSVDILLIDPDGEIPDWCPLEDKDDFCESNFDIDRPL